MSHSGSLLAYVYWRVPCLFWLPGGGRLHRSASRLIEFASFEDENYCRTRTLC